MNSKEISEMEEKLRKECGVYIILGREQKRDETMEFCVKAFMALGDYRIALEKEEARRAGTPGEQLK